MRYLPKKLGDGQKLIVQGVYDYYGVEYGMPTKDIPRMKEVAIHMIGRQKGIKLDDEQREDMWCIKNNLKDEVYRENLITNPPDIGKY